MVDGDDVVPQVHAVLDRMAKFSNRVRSGVRRGHTGKPIKNIINIGIGGSDLGPVMAYEALKHYSDRSRTFRFVSNIDGSDLAEAVRDIDPAETARVQRAREDSIEQRRREAFWNSMSVDDGQSTPTESPVPTSCPRSASCNPWRANLLAGYAA